ncbi:MAG: hypothetical protein LAT82_02165 [Nanoarchaeota archaeon]|nr:hypothetical protein [Nanoarchaeota archaeon]
MNPRVRSEIRGALNILSSQPFGEPINPNFLTFEYQIKTIFNILQDKQNIRRKFSQAIEVEFENIAEVDDFFSGEEDCFELRVVKSKFFPVSQSLYCHNTTLYLLGERNEHTLLCNRGEGSAQSHFRDLKKPRKGFENLEVKLYYGSGDTPLKHSIVLRDGLVFDRMCNNFPFHIVPLNGYYANYGYFDSETRRRFIKDIEKTTDLKFDGEDWKFSN